jgi:acyl dehydratase
MPDFSEYIGRPTGASRIVVERGPIAAFARAITDDDPVYQDADAAREAGFENVPAPPTYTFAIGNWGRFPEQQPEDPTGGVNPMAEVMGGLMASGGMVLHGEQEFTYHRPIVVGDVLEHRGVVKDIYTKESKGRTMTFMVIEDTYADADGRPVVTSTMNLLHRS